MAWDYTQTGDPGSVGVGKTWLHPTTGVLKVRNTTNTAWTTIGNVDDPNFGSLLTSGGAVSANITGNTGWAASDAHNFPTTASINNVAIATINDVASRISALESSIVPLISSAIATYASSLTFANNIAFASGTVISKSYDQVHTLPISSMQYGDGSTPTESECKWFISLVAPNNYWWVGYGGSIDQMLRCRNAADTADVNIHEVSQFRLFWNQDGVGDRNEPCHFSYFILALRP